MQKATEQHTQAPARPRLIMSTVTPTAASLKGCDPDFLLDHLEQEVAEQTVLEWRQMRQQSGAPQAQAKTNALYNKNTTMLEIKYGVENNCDPGLLTPVDILKKLFSHSRQISPAAWRVYRAGFLHVMNERARAFEDQGLPQPTLIRALAALIVVSSPPYAPVRAQRKRVSRTKSIKAADFDKIITHLATAYSERNQVARRAQSFAMSTIATGLRPSEWANATLRPAAQAEVPPGEPAAGWLALEVGTAKRKQGEPDWKRTIIVEPGIYAIHIRQHYDAMHEFLASESGAEDPVTNYLKRASRALKRACVELWPKATRGQAPVRITLYTLRHQARANVAAAFGGFVAAAMMGHSPSTGENWYSGKHRAHSSSRKVRNAGVPVPIPGQDVLQKANEFMNNPDMMQEFGTSDDDTDGL